MSVDVKLKTEEGNFKYRVSGIIKVEEKILVVKMGENDFYCLPGGHVELGEDTQTAILREMKEETGYNIINPNLIAIAENFFINNKGKRLHELGFYYTINIKPPFAIQKENYKILEHDKDKDVDLEFMWIDIDLLNTIDFRPQFLISKLQSRSLDLSHHILRE